MMGLFKKKTKQKKLDEEKKRSSLFSLYGTVA